MKEFDAFVAAHQQSAIAIVQQAQGKTVGEMVKVGLPARLARILHQLAESFMTPLRLQPHSGTGR